jgi:CRP/FNR family transcriptional regulator, cyclic AMP receptor protein
MMNKHAPDSALRDLLRKIGNQKTSRGYRNKEIIYRQGDTADAMFYVQDGNVQLSVISKHGKKAVIAILRQGDFFGERCLVRRSLSMSTATAIHQSTIARVKRGTVIRILRKEPPFAKLFISYIVSRMGRIEENFVDQLFNSSEKRLARLLLLLARFEKQSEPQSPVLKLSHQTLAEMEYPNVTLNTAQE